MKRLLISRPLAMSWHNGQRVLVEKQGRRPEFGSTHLPRSAFYETTCQSQAPMPPLPAARAPRTLSEPLSGRCGDWIWYLRGGKQCRRRYARPRDPGTLAQLLCRARLSTASRILLPQRVVRSISGIHHSPSRVSPGSHRLGADQARTGRGGSRLGRKVALARGCGFGLSVPAWPKFYWSMMT